MSGRIETSYARQADWEAKVLDLPSCYCRPHSVDAWRHRRMRETVLPLVTALPRATWMTVGDGSYGSDAHFLQGYGVEVVATSITDNGLTTAYERGYVRNIRVENAESLSGGDDSCDFVLCKESYHHFPRPPIAFYEMFRVARKAVVLIEPIEGALRILDGLKVLFKRLVRGDDSTFFEPSGNFVYRVNVGEILKMATGLGAPCAAVKRFNDFYIPRFSHQPCRGLSPGWLATRLGILAQDGACALWLMNHGLATVVVFKDSIPSAERDLSRSGFRMSLLPRNPYLQRASP